MSDEEEFKRIRWKHIPRLFLSWISMGVYVFFIFPMFIVYCSTHLLYQEYVEPLILLMFFLALKTQLQKTYFNNVSFSHLIFISYFTIYLLGSIYFKHFAFGTFQEWKIFLN